MLAFPCLDYVVASAIAAMGAMLLCYSTYLLGYAAVWVGGSYLVWREFCPPRARVRIATTVGQRSEGAQVALVGRAQAAVV